MRLAALATGTLRFLASLPKQADRAIGVALPSWGYRRMRNRVRMKVADQQLEFLSTFEAAAKNRLTKDWDAKNSAVDQIISEDFATILGRSRAASRDDWQAASIKSGNIRAVVGTGITARADVRDVQTGKPLKAINAAQNSLYERWARTPEWCDVEGRKSIIDMQSLAVGEEVEAGNAFAVLSYEPRIDMVGLKIQMFEIEQLDWSITRSPATGNKVRFGIEVDQHGKAVAYFIFTGRHPLDDHGIKSERIPASRVLHYMDQDRPRQSIGLTRMAPVLKQLRHSKMYRDYTLVRARYEASITTAIETDFDAPNGGDIGGLLGPTTNPTSADSDKRNNKQFRLEPGAVWKLPRGMTAKSIAMQTPGGQYEPFMARQTEEISAGAGSDAPTVSRNFGRGSFSAQLQGKLESWKAIDPEQQRLIGVWCRPIWETFQRLAILEGRIPMTPAQLADFNLFPEIRAAFIAAVFQPQPKQWLDPAKQAAANKILHDQQLITHRELLNERNLGLEETLDQLAEEQRQRAERGLPLPGQEVLPQEPRPEQKPKAPSFAPEGVAEAVASFSRATAPRKFNGGAHFEDASR